MHYTALIGNPVEHSVSPVMFESFAAQCGLEYRHLKIQVEPDHLPQTLTALTELGFCGANVTLPFKQDVAQYIDHLDDDATACGAVNTITFKGRQTEGSNTDWKGIVGGLAAHGTDTCTRTVIFGSGGAARAAIHAVKHMGCKDIIALYREPLDDKTQSLLEEAETLGVTMLPYDHLEEVVTTADVICNMSSTGMRGQAPTPFELGRLDGVDCSGKVFLEAVFNPVQTPLLRYFKGRGVTTVDGLWMMIYQGLAAFEQWTDQKVVPTKKQLEQLHEQLSIEVEK